MQYVFLHNMIIEDERRAICESNEDENNIQYQLVDGTQKEHNRLASGNEDMHDTLCLDLVEHIWSLPIPSDNKE